MSLFTKWRALAETERTQEEYNAFWGEYLQKEQAVYEVILENPNEPLTGTVAALGKKYGMDSTTFLGFLDGINTSLKEAYDLEDLKATNKVILDVDLEKLYYNMLDAQADWLYDLPQWDSLLDENQRKDIKKSYSATKTVVKDRKVGRNEPCPCGSGKKYKQCCLNK